MLYGIESECKIAIVYEYNTNYVRNSSSCLCCLGRERISGFLAAADIVVQLYFCYFSLNSQFKLAMHTKVDLQIAQCTRRICALQSSSSLCHSNVKGVGVWATI